MFINDKSVLQSNIYEIQISKQEFKYLTLIIIPSILFVFLKVLQKLD